MSHVYSFFLASLLVYLTPGLFCRPSFGKYLGAGLVAGLIVLIRPSNIVLLFYPLLYGVISWKSFGGRLVFLQKNWPKLLVAAAVAAVLWLPQMWYWHYLSGHWFIDPYYTESFKFWNRPLVHYVLFSYLNGLFIYNPVLLLPVAALFFMLKNNCLNAWASLLVFAVSTYIFSSWWCWWFGGAYGHRCYVELLPILVLPTGFVFSQLFKIKHKWLKTSALAIIGLLVFYNVRMVILYKPAWSDMSMNWDKYWKVFEKVFFL